MSGAAPEGVTSPSGATERATRNPAGAVYGTVIAGSLIATEGSRDAVDLPRLITLVLVGQLVYWLAHVYADLLALRIGTGHRPRRSDLREVLREEWPLVAASFGPLLVLAVLGVAGAAANTAVLAGLWTAVAVLGSWALVAGRRARIRGLELACYVAVSAAFGGVMILLKVSLH